MCKFKSIFLYLIIGIPIIFLCVYYENEIHYYFIPIITIIFVAGVFFLLKYKKLIHIDNTQLVTVLGIVLTALFFLLQNFQTIKDTRDTLNTIDEFNCNTAGELFGDIVSDVKVHHISISSEKYSTDIYRNDISYILHTQGTTSTTTNLLFAVTQSMDRSNEYIDIINSENESKLDTFINAPFADKISWVNTYDQSIEQYDWQIAELASSTLVDMNKLDPTNCSLNVLNSFPFQNFSTFSSY